MTRDEMAGRCVAIRQPGRRATGGRPELHFVAAVKHKLATSIDSPSLADVISARRKAMLDNGDADPHKLLRVTPQIDHDSQLILS